MRPQRSSRASNRIRLLALVSGLLGFVLAILAPVLPVRQDDTVLEWPQAGATDVEAPLVSYQPLRLDLTVPCPVLGGAEGTVVATVPDESGKSSARGLRVSVSGDTLSVVLRDVPLLAAERAELAGCESLSVVSTAASTTAEIAGAVRAGGTPVRAQGGGGIRPRMVGGVTRGPAAPHARVSAWGFTGPWAGRRGFDSIVQAATGIAVIEGASAVPGALPAQATSLCPNQIGSVRRSRSWRQG
ncbi:hypothetical protein [Nocardia carnea]|uniref:hypothetical protein n=1 Tax=Nocardia carnea TaxID=37328 RepID=UPI002454B875|nr:hypothetical protein [Nocardia carnea]